VNATMLIAIVFAMLLGLEWRYRLKSMRVAAAALAIVVLFFAAPNYTRAARQALETPAAERVTHIRGSRLSEYVSGVRTMEHSVGEDSNMDANARLLSLGILFWLACSPVLWRTHHPASEAIRTPGSGKWIDS
jgi:hypothetical protein